MPEPRRRFDAHLVDPHVGMDELSDDARLEGQEYRGREARRVEGRRLPRRFREMVESDEDA